jgi:hypothetical protein
MRSVNFGKAIPFAALRAARLKRATGVFLDGSWPLPSYA